MHAAVFVAFLLWPISAERDRDSHGVIASDAVTTANEASLTGCRKKGTCDLYTLHNVTIPTYVQAADLARKLSYIRETQLPNQLTTREDVVIENSMRYALLAYGRNDAKGLVYHALRNAHGLVALELQFKSLRHVKGEVDDTAHMVAYLIKGEAPARGFGVVLAYKGSTNSVDWKINMDSQSVLLFPDLPDEKTNYVHQGFLGHKQRLDERMKKAPMAPLKDSLKLWGIETSAENFRDFLLEATWNWCICVGHSMGGALAAISALDLAIHTKQLREKKAKDETIPGVYAVGIASAIPGSEGFSESMDRYVKPHGGLRIANYGDVVTYLGYGKMSFRRSKRTTAGYEWTLHHSVFTSTFKKLKMHIQFDIKGRGKLTRYLFSAMGKTMKSNEKQIGDLSVSTLFSED